MSSQESRLAAILILIARMTVLKKNDKTP
jgi:hypothetical protein